MRYYWRRWWFFFFLMTSTCNRALDSSRLSVRLRTHILIIAAFEILFYSLSTRARILYFIRERGTFANRRSVHQCVSIYVNICDYFKRSQQTVRIYYVILFVLKININCKCIICAQFVYVRTYLNEENCKLYRIDVVSVSKQEDFVAYSY